MCITSFALLNPLTLEVDGQIRCHFYNPKGKVVISIFAVLFVDRTVQS